MLDTPPAVGSRAILFGDLCVNVQHEAIGFVANGVNSQLQTRLVGSQSHFQHVAFGKHHFVRQAGRFWGIVEGLLEKRGGRAQGTVGKALQ